jgi:hypothetical protein
MQNYNASFTSDAQLGWYLQKESYDWKQSNDVIHSEYVYENHGIAISAIEKTTTTTTLADGDGTSTTTTTSTDTSAWKGGNLKIESSAKTSKSSKADGSSSTSTSTTTYEYNELGKLKGASGKTETTGTNKGGGTYTSSSINSYIIKNGQALPSKSTTTGSVKGTTDEKNSNFSETTTYEYQLIAGNWQLVKEISVSRSNGTNDSTETITRTKIYSRNTKGVCTGITQTATGSAGIGRWGFTLQSYNAEFALDAKAGWYLKQESYSWQWQG